MLSNDNKKSLIKFLVSGTLNCITGDAFKNFVTSHLGTAVGTGLAATGLGIVAPIAAGVINSISGNLASEHFGKFANSDDLLKWLESHDVDQTNHDLEKALIRASVNAISFLEVLLTHKLRNDESWPDMEFGHRKSLIKDLKKFFKTAKKSVAAIKDEIEIKREHMHDSSTLLRSLAIFILSNSSVTLSDDAKERFLSLYESKMSYCFDLAFKEELKTNDRAYKAFQIWIAESIQLEQLKDQALQVRILNAITELRERHDQFSRAEMELLAQTQTDKILNILEVELPGVSKAVKAISELLGQTYFSVLAISEKADSLLTKTDEQAAQLSQLLNIATIHATQNQQLEDRLEFLVAQLSTNDISKSQEIFLSSHQVKNLITEIEKGNEDSELLRNNYYQLKKEYAENNGDEVLTLLHEAYNNWIRQTELVSQRKIKLDNLKIFVLDTYTLLFRRYSASKSDVEVKAEQYFSQGDFEKVVEVFNSVERDEERNRLMEEEAQLNQRKEQFAANDLLNALALIRDGEFGVKYDDKLIERVSYLFESAIRLHATAQTYYHYAFFLETIYEFDKAILMLKSASRSSLSKQLYLQIIAMLGRIYVDSLDYLKAEETLLELLTVIQKTVFISNETRDRYLSRTYNSFSMLYNRLKRYVDAAAYAEKQIGIDRRLAAVDFQTYGGSLAGSLVNRGVIHKNMLELVQAESNYIEARSILANLIDEKPELKIKLGVLVHNLMVVSRLLYKEEDAINAGLEAIEIYQDLFEFNPRANTMPLSMSHAGLGDCYLIAGDLEKAENHQLQARKMILESQGICKLTFLPLAGIENSLGLIYSQTDNFILAKNSFQLAIDYTENLADENDTMSAEKGTAYRNLGNCLIKLQEWNLAETCLFKAKAEIQKAIQKFGQYYYPIYASLLRNLGDFYVGRPGPKKQVTLAIENYKESIELCFEMYDGRENISISNMLQEVYKCYDELQQYSQATSYLIKWIAFDQFACFSDLEETTAYAKTWPNCTISEEEFNKQLRSEYEKFSQINCTATT